MLFGKWSGTEVKLDGEDLLIMKESDILGVLEGDRNAKKKRPLSQTTLMLEKRPKGASRSMRPNSKRRIFIPAFETRAKARSSG